MEKVWLGVIRPACRPRSIPTSSRRLPTCSRRASRSMRTGVPSCRWTARSATRELDELSRHFGAWLQQVAGLRKGDRVAIMLPNVLQYPVALFGALRAGSPSSTPTRSTRRASSSTSCTIRAPGRSSSSRTSRTCSRTCSRRPTSSTLSSPASATCSASRSRRSSNFVVRHVRKQVPAYSPPAQSASREALEQGPLRTSRPCSSPRRHRLPAVHRRHHRRVQGRDAHPPQHGRERAAGRGLVRTRARRAREPRSPRCPCTTSSRLTALPAVHDARRGATC